MDVIESAVNAVQEALKHGETLDQFEWLTEVIDVLEVIRYELEDQIIREEVGENGTSVD
ncbi:MAG: hypothetical protein J3T61_00590 [Candidatus Brocadiales bacterium]|nr:hypothetical protein [Candidatus Bathyanammoxibius sp.]